MSYDIGERESPGKLDLAQTVLAFFAKSEPDRARFEIAIKTALGESVKICIRRPTLNLGTATVTFRI